MRKDQGIALTGDTVVAEPSRSRVPKVVKGGAKRISTAAKLVNRALSSIGETVGRILTGFTDTDGSGTLTDIGDFAVSCRTVCGG